MLEIDFTLGPLRFRFVISNPASDEATEYLSDTDLADDDETVTVGFRR
jgi:hypothetical protein